MLNGGRHLLHLTAMSNMSLHCICLVFPFTRTLELLHVRCIACITSSVAKPMAANKCQATTINQLIEIDF